MPVDKNKQAEEARRILNLHPKERDRELSRLAAQSGLSQAEILVILRRQASMDQPGEQNRRG